MFDLLAVYSSGSISRIIWVKFYLRKRKLMEYVAVIYFKSYWSYLLEMFIQDGVYPFLGCSISTSVSGARSYNIISDFQYFNYSVKTIDHIHFWLTLISSLSISPSNGICFIS